MNKHTDLAWEAIDDMSGWVIQAQGERIIAKAYNLYSQETVEANARLIAASPKMLEAIDAVRDWMLGAMTEEKVELEPDAFCPLCYVQEPGSFHSTSESVHWDGCPWPALLTARAQARNDTTP